MVLSADFYSLFRKRFIHNMYSFDYYLVICNTENRGFFFNFFISVFDFVNFICLFCSHFFFSNEGSDLLPAELLEKAEMPKVVFIGFGLAALLCLLLGNAALFAWFIIRKRSKGLFQLNFNFFSRRISK